MSSTAVPISPERFAEALTSLPLANIYSKAAEIRNSIAHLERSNQELQRYMAEVSQEDVDCAEAVSENNAVIERMKGRIELLKQEVEQRGSRWHESDGGVLDDGKAEDAIAATNGSSGHMAAEEASTGPRTNARSGRTSGNGTSMGGGLTDEELERQLLQRMDVDEEEGQNGLHL